MQIVPYTDAVLEHLQESIPEHLGEISQLAKRQNRTFCTPILS